MRENPGLPNKNTESVSATMLLFLQYFTICHPFRHIFLHSIRFSEMKRIVCVNLGKPLHIYLPYTFLNKEMRIINEKK
jgi:hypothetical protein